MSGRGLTLVLLLGLSACTSPDSGDAGGEVQLQLATQAEADAQAAQRIHAGNAEAEFEKLLDDVEAAEKP
jgi:hypothetical protein